MAIEVVAYSADWARQFQVVAAGLGAVLEGVPSAVVEHVGSTAVPGLAAKPILDIDVIVERHEVTAAVRALVSLGYVHRGDLGVPDREAFTSPDHDPRRHVYVGVRGTLHVRNHLAVRDALRSSAELRDRYARVKVDLAADPGIGIDRYIAGKSAVLQEVVMASDLTPAEKRAIFELNTKLAS